MDKILLITLTIFFIYSCGFIASKKEVVLSDENEKDDDIFVYKVENKRHTIERMERYLARKQEMLKQVKSYEEKLELQNEISITNREIFLMKSSMLEIAKDNQKNIQ